MLQKESILAKTKKSASKKTDSPGVSSGHPDHSVHIKRLNRVKGQIEGIERMILDRRYCPDIVAQIKAATAGLKAAEAEILRAHLRGCVKSAFASNDAFKAEEKIQEIIKLIY